MCRIAIRAKYCSWAEVVPSSSRFPNRATRLVACPNCKSCKGVHCVDQDLDNGMKDVIATHGREDSKGKISIAAYHPESANEIVLCKSRSSRLVHRATISRVAIYSTSSHEMAAHQTEPAIYRTSVPRLTTRAPRAISRLVGFAR